MGHQDHCEGPWPLYVGSDLIVVRYVAGRRLKMPDESYVEAGDPVPEAATWRNLQVWINSRAIVVVEDAAPAPSPPAPPPLAIPEAPDPGELLRAALAETRADASSHTKTRLLELADAAGVVRPDPVPRLKRDLIEGLEGGL